MAANRECQCEQRRSALRAEPQRFFAHTQGDFVLLDIWGRKEKAGRGVLRHHVDGRCRQELQPIASRKSSTSSATRATSGSAPCRTRCLPDASSMAGKWTRPRAIFIESRLTDNTSRIAPGTRSARRRSRQRREHGQSRNQGRSRDHSLHLFSIEPGIYLPEFGVRSEINLLIREHSAEVTGKIQQEIVVV